MRELLSQIQRAIDAELYYLALIGALAIPDVCGAMESADGEAKAVRYKSWYKRYIEDRNQETHKTSLKAEECYLLRCSMLHQGRVQHPKSTYTRYVITEPNKGNNICEGNSVTYGEVTVYQIDLRLLCSSLIGGALAWLKDNEDTEVYRTNYERFVKRRPNGEFQVGSIRFAFVNDWPVIA